VTYNDNGTPTTSGYIVQEIILHTAGYHVGATLHDSVLNGGEHQLSLDYSVDGESLAGSLAGDDGTGSCTISTSDQPENKMENQTNYTISKNDTATISCPFS
jgi:hypothetical protein